MNDIQEGQIVSPVTSFSPNPAKVGELKLMDFPEAIKEVIAGKRITKLEWADINTYGYLNGAFLTLHEAHKEGQWILSDGDLNGKDWMLA